MDQRLTRRAFVIQLGATAAVLGAGGPVLAGQTAGAPVPGKERLILRSLARSTSRPRSGS